MINKVIVFGDSFLYGHETNYTDFVEHPDFKKNFKKAVGIEWQLSSDGRLSFHDPKSLSTSPRYEDFNWFQFLESLDDNEKQNCNNNSIGAFLAKKLHAKEYLNFATLGSSNNFILYKVLENQKEITAETIVVCGISFPDRRSRYEPRYHMPSELKNKKYEELNIKFGDDATAKVIQTLAYTQSIKQIVESCNGKVVFIDPFMQFAQDTYHTGKAWDYINDLSDDPNNYEHHDVLKLIDKLNCENFGPGLANVFPWCTENDIHIFTPGGHYSKHVYKQYTEEHLVPYLEDKNVI